MSMPLARTVGMRSPQRSCSILYAMWHLRTSFVALVTLVALSAACGGGSDSKPPTATPGGGAPGGPQYSLDLAAGAPDLAIFGADAGDYLADRFSLTAGDFHGAGKDDILGGAPFATPAGSTAGTGEAYAIFGSSSLEGTLDIAQGTQDFTIAGARAGDYLGYALTAGDVNGDGTDDIIAAASAASPDAARPHAGEAYVA